MGQDEDSLVGEGRGGAGEEKQVMQKQTFTTSRPVLSQSQNNS